MATAVRHRPSFWTLFFGPSTTALLYHVLDQLDSLEVFMSAQFDTVEALITAIDASTNKISDKLTDLAATVADLQAQIAAGSPVTTAQLDTLVGQLQSEADKLSALGADPAAPVPADPAP